MSVLHVPLWAWAATVAALVVLLGADLFVSARRRGPERLGEAALWTAGTIALAVAFGALIATVGSGAAAGPNRRRREKPCRRSWRASFLAAASELRR